MAKIIIRQDEDLEEQVATKKPLKAKKGKILSDPKPENAARVLIDSPILTSRPINVYKERITDNETGKTDWYYWWTTEDSQTKGKDDIVKVNEKTQTETLIGNDFTIKANPQTKQELLEDMTARTKFYTKDGRDRILMLNPRADF